MAGRENHRLLQGMEQDRSSNARSIPGGDDWGETQSSNENQYPDPESLSTRPWWRDIHFPNNSNTLHEHDTSQSINDFLFTHSPIEHESGVEMVPMDTSNTDIIDPREVIERSPLSARVYGLHEDTDSAFKPSSDDTADQSLSELSQASSDEPYTTSTFSALKKPGRPLGRTGRINANVNHREANRRSLKGIKRGPRKPLEPSEDFKSLHTQATAAFIDTDYEKAEELTLQAILLNPEMYAAHSLLSEIHSARGDHDKALTALFNGAHTRPRDIESWETLAQMLLARRDEDNSALTDALYCYSRIIQVDPQNLHARHQRAALNLKLGYMGRAGAEYEHLLKILPHDLSILRSLAEIYNETDNADQVMEHYRASIKFYQAQDPRTPKSFTWSDVNIFVELFADQQRYVEAISALKSLSRWLLGRHGDPIWENFDEDDREWDLDHDPRRSQVQGFQADAYANISYGKGMPLELHVKLGLYRLKSDRRQLKEAMRHFELLNPADPSDARIFEYPDIFRDVADALRGAGFYHEALRYYEPLQRVSDCDDISYYFDMAFCYKSIGRKAEADACYRSIVNLEQDNESTRIRLALDNNDALVVASTMTGLTDRTTAPNHQVRSTGSLWPEASDFTGVSEQTVPSAMLIPRAVKQQHKRRNADKRLRAQIQEENIRTLYGRTQELLCRARTGEVEALLKWMTAAQELVDAFRSHRAFYPCDRNLKTHGQLKVSAIESLKFRVDQAMQNIVGQIGAPSDDPGGDPAIIVGDFHGIPFSAWLDLMLEYAILLVRSQNVRKAYEILNVAESANICYSSTDSMFLIHVCWFTCALVVNDAETSCSVARWFMKEYRFISDGYRLFCALHRLCDGKNMWFNCGPTQKFVRRQLKAMDYSLLDQTQRRMLYQERASYTTKDEEGKHICAGDMDLALLTLYGYVLYLGKSFALSLNYFFRAYVLDSGNPIINLSLALAYIQHAMKRQSANRHRLITQGLTFLFCYYDLRSTSRSSSERQEAEFNVARTYHMLGLTHLAVPYYERCLCLGHRSHGEEVKSRDYFSADAALSLRNIWAANEETGKAADITRNHLVI